MAIVSAPFFRGPGIGIVFALCRARSAWLQDAIAKAPKRLEPSCDFRARFDPIGVDDVLPLQFPIVGLGKHKVGGHGRHRNHARSGSMANVTSSRDMVVIAILTTVSILWQHEMSPLKFG
jgi:hypothetical protein